MRERGVKDKRGGKGVKNEGTTGRRSYHIKRGNKEVVDQKSSDRSQHHPALFHIDQACFPLNRS